MVTDPGRIPPIGEVPEGPRPPAGAPPTPPHLVPSAGFRGLRSYPPVAAAGGVGIRVSESPTSGGPHVWLAVSGHTVVGADAAPFGVTAHLGAEEAWHLAEQLMALVAGHYQGDARPGDRVAEIFAGEVSR